MGPEILHLHTYFLFPFSIDKQAVLEDHADLWAKHRHWMDGLDRWVATPPSGDSSPVFDLLGPWRRSPYTRFDMDSPAYQDMVFFHPFVRRVFFDAADSAVAPGEKESLLRCYSIPLGEGKKVWFHAADQKQRSAAAEVTNLQLFLFANGIGILSLGVEATHVPVAQALWINEMLRKVYPSSGRQVREGRIPDRMALELERDGERRLLAEERFTEGKMIGVLPPLAKIITALLYFADYGQQEFRPVLDERCIVYCHAAMDPATVPPDYIHSEDYQIFLSHLLYVDQASASYRYEPDFVKEQMRRQLYTRWAHHGTYYGFTSYSNITVTLGTFDADEHQLREGFLIHRMFDSRYYLMALVALFYRATLVDFEERVAVVSKRLYLDQEDGMLSRPNIRTANDLRAEFLHFSNYWYFAELANKDEEVEHFTLQCQQYRLENTKKEIEEEIEKLDASLHSYFQMRNTDAVNRLAMLSLIVGAGAVLTGFFGMNFGHWFGRVFFQPDEQWLGVRYAAVALVFLFAFGALSFGFYMVFANWSDYRDILVPRRLKSPRAGGQISLRKD